MKLEVVHCGIKEFTVELKHTPTAANPDVRMNVLLKNTLDLLAERGWKQNPSCNWSHTNSPHVEMSMANAMLEEAMNEL